MSDVAISVRGLSKSYKIAHDDQKHITLAETILSRLKNPMRRPRFETFWALKDVNFEIPKGDVVGIIGRNGAGKSTLLKVLSRITEPTTGEIDIYGRVGSLLEVGTGFHPELTGRENVFLNGAILGMSKDEIRRQFDAIVDFAGVEQFLDTPVKRYSSGMYVRLAFAVAAHLNPEILIVDEVLAVGDAEFQKKCLGKMGEVARGGRTVLFVSHNTSAILNLCTRAAWFRNGTLVELGETEPIVRKYAESLASAGAAALTEISDDRMGKGETRFTALHMYNEYGAPIAEAVSGRPLHIRLDYESAEKSVIRNFRASLCFFDSVGQVLFNCSSELGPDRLDSIRGTGSIELRIDRLPLSQGTYKMVPFLEVEAALQDWFQSGVPLTVHDGNFYGGGCDYPQGWQGKGVLVPHSWSAVASTKDEMSETAVASGRL